MLQCCQTVVLLFTMWSRHIDKYKLNEDCNHLSTVLNKPSDVHAMAWCCEG